MLIKLSHSIKYLGIQIDKTLTFSNHVATIINKTEAVRHHLYPILNNKNPLPLTTKTYIHKTHMRPILNYAAPAWYSNISKTNQKKTSYQQVKR